MIVKIFLNREIPDPMGPGWEPADKGLDIWQLEPSQEGNLRLCYNLMASTHKCKKPATFILHAGSPELSALPLPKPSLGILAWLLLYARIPQPVKPTHLTTNRESKHYETSASLCLTHHTVLSRARISRAICLCEDSAESIL